ncbi:MAG: hypothetical protein HC910_20430 [Spirulinaceae cyanobacterium SM2_1_0]|nr:hypothetical protein [Spirulinaceae cyanobacterium SM2_1_0]
MNANLVKRLVAINVGMMDEYWPGIERVLAGEQRPAEAIATLEQSDRP